jgi:hypothetical protein
MQQSESNQTPLGNLRQNTRLKLLMVDTSSTISQPGCGRQTLIEITHDNVWEKNYTVQIPSKEIDMLPSGDIDAYTDGSLMGGKSGAGAFIIRREKKALLLPKR